MLIDATSDLFGSASATFDDDRIYRYRLTRRWDAGAALVFCMLNPSTADAFTADATIRRCLGFARRNGLYGSLTVVNLFALRSTDPAALKAHSDPVGPDNDAVLRDVFTDSDTGRVVAAWGAQGALRCRAHEVAALAAECGQPLWALGYTNAGLPRHPLYVRGDAALVPFPAVEGVA